ncbi:predicted protein [Verticillium alfalfae VaMs.102]|uniref:Predicted protein n=1 Tax=Verticillium alfalfae (strain VaMs.102 / ATCC MYA-4576 / FGSC 10136) TaxID=526221 RepID=C9SN69_VERA1|nr:predicted protein [Verticillium alfalfae VaMs.102]EEY20234.1 predicted protein [Verticillium alfalfae VaMs.102]
MGAKESSEQKACQDGPGQAFYYRRVQQAQIAADDDDDDDDDSFSLCGGDNDATGHGEHEDEQEHEQEGHADFAGRHLGRTFPLFPPSTSAPFPCSFPYAPYCLGKAIPGHPHANNTPRDSKRQHMKHHWHQRSLQAAIDREGENGPWTLASTQPRLEQHQARPSQAQKGRGPLVNDPKRRPLRLTMVIWSNPDTRWQP